MHAAIHRASGERPGPTFICSQSARRQWRGVVTSLWRLFVLGVRARVGNPQIAVHRVGPREPQRNGHFPAVSLVTLGACSTGFSDVLTSGDRFVGLPGMLLKADAPALVASLWPVRNYATPFSPIASANSVAVAKILRLRLRAPMHWLMRVARLGVAPPVWALVAKVLGESLLSRPMRMRQKLAACTLGGKLQHRQVRSARVLEAISMPRPPRNPTSTPPMQQLAQPLVDGVAPGANYGFGARPAASSAEYVASISVAGGTKTIKPSRPRVRSTR